VSRATHRPIDRFENVIETLKDTQGARFFVAITRAADDGGVVGPDEYFAYQEPCRVTESSDPRPESACLDFAEHLDERRHDPFDSE
jgi:hypothetical protein